MRIAILGTRGIPANYGGFETFAQELSVRLAERGHEVCVYCRRFNYPEPMRKYRGVHLVTLPSIHTRALDTLSHALLSTFHVLLNRADVVLYCNCATSCFAWMPRLRGMKVVMNPDGLEWERVKWGWGGKTFYRLSEHLAAWFPHRLVSDSHVIQEYYRERFGCDSDFVAYGADIVERGAGWEMLEEFGIEPERYFLYVSRLEPENNAHLVVEAFEQVDTDMHLMVVGSAPFADEYIRRLTRTNDKRVIFPGALYGDVYRALRANAYVYVNAMEVGGTHPAILEAMGAGNCVLVSDIAYNVEAVAEAGVQFKSKDMDDCRAKMQWLVDHPDDVRRFREHAVERVRTQYSWDNVVSEYERLFESLLAD
ncbi:MAG TPA: DUF1972 domain-containing protein [Candidatus Hydrogenedentes bacterium]|nr:DUF1972 domain-containing protein [Candidatus Hydrogenedentota bacterium]MDY0030433.1 DUF1972 domain-containing protein [FCB group bacterium]NLT61623.1 glycosyltransferase family 1 protein [Candidatus Hydrogenedentota bacterium]HNZ19067.1 DUF1972 domain-containing protein [Candidatus Hydrogenedentota bacterium]HOH33664.1 DUF1972 domain-containing protein [Candidatus Hydrogenedentota bacterium]